MWNLSKFAESLKELMIDRDLKAPALAEQIGTHRTNITRYLRGERAPVFSGLIKLVEYFDCSADFLLGLSEYSKEGGYLPPLDFAKRLREVMKENSVTQYALEKKTKISGDIVYKWLNGITKPSIENLVKLAEYIDCSVDYLLGRVR